MTYGFKPVGKAIKNSFYLVILKRSSALGWNRITIDNIETYNVTLVDLLFSEWGLGFHAPCRSLVPHLGSHWLDVMMHLAWRLILLGLPGDEKLPPLCSSVFYTLHIFLF